LVQGEFTALQGVNIYIYEDGYCEVLGKDVNKMSDEEKTSFRGKNIGFVFQSFNLLSS